MCGQDRSACAVCVRSVPKSNHATKGLSAVVATPKSPIQQVILRVPAALGSLTPPTTTQSGRQDLNLRPPGPQPEGWGAVLLMRPGFIGFSVSVCCAVLLSLFPNLFPKHLFGCAQDQPVGVLIECQRGHWRAQAPRGTAQAHGRLAGLPRGPRVRCLQSAGRSQMAWRGG